METLGRFDYINEEEIDELLKCIICMKPHMDPVWTNCTDENHIFCRLCIEKYIEKQKACPKCQQHLSKEDLTPNSDRSLIMLLNKLRVKCSHCNKEGLKRIDFDNHFRNMCLEGIVACLAADMNCSWNGPRRKLEKHLKKCRVYHLKDVITELRHENKHLKDQVNQHSNEIDQMKDKLLDGQDQLQGLMDSFKQVKEQAHQQSIEMKQLTDTLSEQKTQFQKCMNILKSQTQVIELLSERKENSQSGLAVNAHEQMILGRNLSNNEVRNPFLIHSQFQRKADDTKLEYELQQPNNETKIYANKDEQQLSVHGQKQFFNGISTVYDAFNSSGETYPSVPITELPTLEPSTHDNSRSNPSSNTKNTRPVVPDNFPHANNRLAPPSSTPLPSSNFTLGPIIIVGNANLNIGENANVGGNVGCHANVGHRYADTNTDRQSNRNTHKNTVLNTMPNVSTGCGENHAELDNVSDVGSNENTGSVRSANDHFDRSSIHGHILDN